MNIYSEIFVKKTTSRMLIKSIARFHDFGHEGRATAMATAHFITQFVIKKKLPLREQSKIKIKIIKDMHLKCIFVFC